MHLLIELAVAGLSLVVLLQMTPSILRHLRAPNMRWTAVGLLALVLGGMLGDTRYLEDIAAVKMAYSAVFIASMLLALAGPARRANPPAPVAPLVGLICLWAWLFTANIVQNSVTATSSQLLMRLAPGAIWMALLVVWRRNPVERKMLSEIAAFAISVLGLLVPLFRGIAWRACDQYKCGVFGGMLTGPYTSENYLAQQVAIIAILFIVSNGVRRATPLLALTAVWLVATESRTSQYALLAAVSTALLLAAVRRAVILRDGGAGRRLFLSLIPLVFILAAGYLVFNVSPTEFSTRGNVWIQAVALIEQNPILGLGISRWGEYADMGYFSGHFPHSLYVFVAFAGGIIGLVLLYNWVRSALVNAVDREGRLDAPLALAVVFLTVGLFEVVTNPIAVDGTTWIPLALMSLGPTISATAMIENPKAEAFA